MLRPDEAVEAMASAEVGAFACAVLVNARC